MIVMLFRAFLVSLLGLMAFGASAQAAGIAKVAGLSGGPTANGRMLTQGADIQEHDRIVVGNGNVQLIFTDGTRLVVGEHSTLVVEKYLMKSGSQVSNFSIDALSGTFRFITGGSAKNAYDIQTANATIGIRGTGFDFYVAGRTGVVVLEGRVQLCAKGSACISINEGCNAGFAEGRGASKMNDAQFNTAAQHLPYLQNQASLKQPFKLYIGSCRSRFAEDLGGGNGSGKPQRPIGTPVVRPNGGR